MPRIALKFTCSEADRLALEHLAFNRAGDPQTVERAQMVLGCLDGKQITEVAQAFRTRPNTVIKWRDRFAQRGLSGLSDAPRSGAHRTYDETFRRRVLALLETEPPEGAASWDGPAVAAVLKSSDDAVWRVLRKEGICLRRRRSWRVTTERELTAKTADLVGLYLDPPRNALVVRMGEPLGLPPRERASGFVLTDHGQTVRALVRAHKRHGTLDLAGALRVGTTTAPAAFTEEKRQGELVAFMDRLIAEGPAEGELHFILDSHFAQKKNQAWLARYEGQAAVHVASAGWLNEVVLWVSLLSAHPSPAATWQQSELKEAMTGFLAAYDPSRLPFCWRRGVLPGGGGKRDNIVKLCK